MSSVNQNSESSGVIQYGILCDYDCFMSISYIAALRSKNSATQAGACIVNEDNRIVGIGSNCFMKVEKNSHGYYAIMDAILNTNSYDCKNCALFVLSFPCNESAKLIIQSGIKRVVYVNGEYKNDQYVASRKLLEMAGVELIQYVPKKLQILIDLKSDIGSQKKLKSDNNKNDWNYFMSIAYLASRRSKDPHTQVGACIVNEDNRIVGIGYNCFPNKCSDDELPWARSNPDPLENKYLFVCHAEMNAILHTKYYDCKNCTIFVTLFPCEECARFIIRSGIKRVVYLIYKEKYQGGKNLLEEAHIPLNQLNDDEKQSFSIDFNQYLSK